MAAIKTIAKLAVLQITFQVSSLASIAVAPLPVDTGVANRVEIQMQLDALSIK